MIKNVSDKLSKLNSEANTLLVSSTVDSVDFGNYKNEKEASNPFLKKRNIESNIQQYFNDRYFVANNNIKNVISKLSDKNSDINSFVNDTIIDINVNISKFFYNNTLKINENDKNIYAIKKNKNTYNLIIKNQASNTIVDFTYSSLIKVEKTENDEKNILYFRKQNILDKLLSKNRDNIKVLKKYNSLNQLLEEVYFSKTQIPEKYVKYSSGKKQYEIIFDISDWQIIVKDFSSNTKIIPYEYIEYDSFENIASRLDFQYAKPSRYVEYNSNTGKITKIFSIQGMSSLVSKYFLYNSITGQTLAFGNL